MDLKDYKTAVADEDGRWFHDGDASFRVASLNSKSYRDAVQAKIEENRDLFRRAARRFAPPHVKVQAREMRDKITLECIAKLLVKDWQNVTENGQPVAFSSEAALDLMTRYPKFADLICDMAMEDAEAEADANAEGVDNLKKK